MAQHITPGVYSTITDMTSYGKGIPYLSEEGWLFQRQDLVNDNPFTGFEAMFEPVRKSFSVGSISGPILECVKDAELLRVVFLKRVEEIRIGF